MNQLNEEIRVIQTQISYLEDKLYHAGNLMSEEQIRSTTDKIIELRQELQIRLKQVEG